MKLFFLFFLFSSSGLYGLLALWLSGDGAGHSSVWQGNGAPFG